MICDSPGGSIVNRFRLHQITLKLNAFFDDVQLLRFDNRFLIWKMGKQPVDI